MMADLPRLKPDPIPAIHPVPEYAATGALAAAYDRTKAGLGVPWMGVVAMAFAHYPRFYDTLWSAMAPGLGHAGFADACHDLRRVAEQEADALRPPPLLPRLERLGYDRQEIDEIRACNTVFSDGNMPYLLMAALARHLLEGAAWKPDGNIGPQRPWPAPRPKPPLIEAHHADPGTAALYDDIRATLGLPFVNTDYRAFARWPSYFAPAWADLKTAVTTPRYERHASAIHHRVMRHAASLPNPAGVTPCALRAAAAEDASVQEVLAVVRLFQWLLPGLALNVAFLRAQLS